MLTKEDTKIQNRRANMNRVKLVYLVLGMLECKEGKELSPDSETGQSAVTQSPSCLVEMTELKMMLLLFADTFSFSLV